MRSAAHLEAFLIKQRMLFFLHISNVLGMCRGMRMRLHASYVEACSCIFYNLKITFYILKGSILKYRHLAISIVNYLDRGELLFHHYFTSSMPISKFGQTLLWRTLQMCDNNLSPSLAVLVASLFASSIRSPYLCSKHLIISWIIHDRLLSRYSFLCSKFFNVTP